MFKRIAGVPVVSQDELIPRKLKDYLSRHPEIDLRLNKTSKRELLVTDITPAYVKITHNWFKTKIGLKKVKL